jgi:hypothetical protein
MDNRPVVNTTLQISPTEAYWYCPECLARNEESAAIDISDLTCQECGANYKNGGVLGTNCSTCKHAHYCDDGSPDAECTSPVYNWVYSEKAAAAHLVSI